MDSNMQQWQQAFKQATPQVDLEKLISQVKTGRRNEIIKASLDLLLGMFVSIYCIYHLIVTAESLAGYLLFAVITPIPVGFGYWAYLLRRKQWRMQTENMATLLSFRRKQLTTQIKYWQVNLWICVALWLGILAIFVAHWIMGNNLVMWAIQLGVNSPVVVFVVLRYLYLKRTLPAKLKLIATV